MKIHHSIIKFFHTKYVFRRRADVLAKALSDFIPNGSSVLDVGCGNGYIDNLILQSKPSINIKGLEVLKREDCLIECDVFNGEKIPFENQSFDICMFVDALHHTHRISRLLEEAHRVSRKYIIIKDHVSENIVDYATLKSMDWIGNRPYDVNLVYNYIGKKQWEKLFSDIGLENISWRDNFNLYTYPIQMILGRKLHFIALLEKKVDRVQ